MITSLLKILSKIRLANHSNKEKGNIISEDLLSIEPHKQECLNNLKNDLSSIKKRINTLIALLITLIVTILIGFASETSEIKWIIRAVLVGSIILVSFLLLFDVLLYLWETKLFDERSNNKISNQQIIYQRQKWLNYSHRIAFLKFLILGIILFATIVILM